MQWRSVQEKIHEKECALPDTRLSLNATLNINPAQLTSYHSLATDCQTLNIEKFSQSVSLFLSLHLFIFVFRLSMTLS
jgi:hypothetical protein